MVRELLLDILFYIPDWIATLQARRNKGFMDAVKNPQKKEYYVDLT